MAKDKNYIRLIHTTRWLRLRRYFLTVHPCCQDCLDNGLPAVPATEVHHIVPVEDAVNAADMERLMFNTGNLRALCHACHLQRHMDLGRSGRAATKRRNEAQVSSVCERFFSDAGEDTPPSSLPGEGFLNGVGGPT